MSKLNVEPLDLLVPAYGLLLARLRPSERVEEEEIRCRFCRSLCRLLSFGASSVSGVPMGSILSTEEFMIISSWEGDIVEAMIGQRYNRALGQGLYGRLSRFESSNRFLEVAVAPRIFAV